MLDLQLRDEFLGSQMPGTAITLRQEDMVPRPRSGREVGPACTSRLVEFVENHWRSEVALRRAGSLHRCVSRLHKLVSMKG